MGFLSTGDQLLRRGRNEANEAENWQSNFSKPASKTKLPTIETIAQFRISFW